MRIKAAIRRTFRALATWGIPTLRPEILETLPHDPEAFTQGLCFSEGALYESTGGHGRSSLRRLDPATGEVLEIIPLEAELWGEGVVRQGGELVQLTWKSGRVLRYSRPGLEPAGEYRLEGEGWGITTAQGEFLVSDGSHLISIHDREFRRLRRLAVRRNGLPLKRLNDLECVPPLIYANVLWDDHLHVISATSGRVVALVDCRELVAIAHPTTGEQVLNGIAYDPAEDVFYLTGKEWPQLFKVRIPPLRSAS